MSPPNASRPATALANSEPRIDLLGGEINSANRNSANIAQTPRAGQLTDRYGHVHSEAVLRHWSPAAIRALGVHRIGGEPEGGGA
jgi:hypothetical protein